MKTGKKKKKDTQPTVPWQWRICVLVIHCDNDTRIVRMLTFTGLDSRFLIFDWFIPGYANEYMHNRCHTDSALRPSFMLVTALYLHTLSNIWECPGSNKLPVTKENPIFSWVIHSKHKAHTHSTRQSSKTGERGRRTTKGSFCLACHKQSDVLSVHTSTPLQLSSLAGCFQISK